MRSLWRAVTAVLLCFFVPIAGYAAESPAGYSVVYSGGSLPTVKGGNSLRLYFDERNVRLHHKGQLVVVIPASAITEVSYGQEVHRRIGTAAGLAVVSLGIGALVAFSKSKKHYIGITWADSTTKGGIALQADKNEYRGLLTALEGVSGKTAVDSGDTQQPVTRRVIAKAAPEPEPISQDASSGATIQRPAPPMAEPQQPSLPKGIIVRFTSTPANAEVQIDGEYWGSTPTADFSRIPAGAHTILIKKPGYQPWERKVSLAAGDDRTVNAELEVALVDPTKPRIAGQN